jgi:hypothetical protein
MAQATKRLDEITFKCKDEWTPCQKKQWCAKIKDLKKLAAKQPGGLSFKNVTAKMKRAKKNAQARYRNNNPPEQNKGEWTDECAKKTKKPVQPDHIHEVQLGGHVDGPLRWLDSSVNTSVGATIENAGAAGVNPVRKFKSVCSPPCPR